MSQDTGKCRTNLKDQFYTKASVAKECIKTIKEQIKEIEIIDNKMKEFNQK